MIPGYLHMPSVPIFAGYGTRTGTYYCMNALSVCTVLAGLTTLSPLFYYV